MTSWFKKTLPPGVLTHDGRHMETYLKVHPTILYRYHANTYGFIALMVLAAVAVGMALYLWLSDGWASVGHGVALGLLLATAALTMGLVGYWYTFTKIHYLATSDQDLIIGEGHKVVAIRWEGVDRDTLGFGTMDPSHSNAAVLSLHLGKATYRLRLFSRYVCLENLQGFMAVLLEHVQGNTQ